MKPRVLPVLVVATVWTLANLGALAAAREAGPLRAGQAPAQADGGGLRATARQLLADTTPWRQALDKLGRQLKAAMPSSMVNANEVETLQRSTEAMNALEVVPFPPIFSKATMKEIAAGKGAQGKLTGAVQEKQRLRQVQSQRKGEIDALRAGRAELKKVVDEFRRQESAARDLSDALAKHAMDADVEVVSRLAGRSIVLSWADFQLTVLEALAERVAAGERALARVDKVLKAAELDLQGFGDALTVTEWLFAEDMSVPTGQDTHGPLAPGGVGTTVQAIEAAVVRNNEVARAAAEYQRAEAAQIRERNAKIDRLSSLLSLAQVGFGVAATGAGAAAPATAKGMSVSQSITVIYQDRAWKPVQRPPSRAQPAPVVEVPLR
jgi:hypothetical protein